MKLTKFDNAKAFLERNAAFLEREEAANNLLLGLAISNQANAEDQSLYLNISDGEEIVFAASRMPGRNLIAFGDETRYDKWASVFTSFISEEQPTLPGVIGPKRIAELLADSIAALRECTTETKFQQMVFELTEVKLNPDIEGKLEKGRIDQLDQIAPWMQAFYREAMHADNDEFAYQTAKSKIELGELYLWSLNGVPQTVCCASRPTPNGITLNFVYTPPASRRQGLATKIVAEVSSKMLEEGYRFCSLFTDLSNPTSNSIYKKIGYREVKEFRSIEFREQ